MLRWSSVYFSATVLHGNVYSFRLVGYLFMEVIFQLGYKIMVLGLVGYLKVFVSIFNRSKEALSSLIVEIVKML